ncbi:hypothetical protein [Pandoraea sp. PE-S2T-3]|uniref:hypothetical protein n=1 Tax=Pandoraea sp. PE-S2T-3 TaxID=1986993 RepID=UPI000B3F9EC6|nr:hypothetical protein [Pandoraea sp. PE-S2T-3]
MLNFIRDAIALIKRHKGAFVVLNVTFFGLVGLSFYTAADKPESPPERELRVPVRVLVHRPLVKAGRFIFCLPPSGHCGRR